MKDINVNFTITLNCSVSLYEKDETAAIEKVNGEISKTMEDLCTSNENIYTEFKLKIDSYCIL